jgi:hypothetical protein
MVRAIAAQGIFKRIGRRLLFLRRFLLRLLANVDLPGNLFQTVYRITKKNFNDYLVF